MYQERKNSERDIQDLLHFDLMLCYYLDLYINIIICSYVPCIFNNKIHFVFTEVL